MAMFPQVTVDTALRLSAIGVLDKENARICGVSVAAIRHWRSGRRRVQNESSALRNAECPQCHGRSLHESAYAYLLGLYLGDGHITHGRRDVYALAIACCDDWPGLMAAAQRAMSAVMPASSVCHVRQHGCTMVKSYSKHWPCLFPQHDLDANTSGKSNWSNGRRISCGNIPANSHEGYSTPMAGVA